MKSPTPQTEIADLSPAMVRSILTVTLRSGGSPERLCRGLGFKPSDFKTAPEVKVSYRQVCTLIRRFKQALGNKASGLAVGSSQTPLSWGLPGVGMLTWRTLEEAVLFAIAHQFDAGALMTHAFSREGRNIVIEAVPKLPDPDFEPFFVEDSFSSILAVVRILVGPEFRPDRIEFAYPKPSNSREYFSTFGCALAFSTGANRLICSAKWLASEIRTYDPYTSETIRQQLQQLMAGGPRRSDFLESVVNYLRSSMDKAVTLSDAALELNMSVRTLSRRLVAYGVSFQKLRDQARCDQAARLLTLTSMRIDEVAAAVGFADPSNFRRAYKRWTGKLPRG